MKRSLFNLFVKVVFVLLLAWASVRFVFVFLTLFLGLSWYSLMFIATYPWTLIPIGIIWFAWRRRLRRLDSQQ